MAEKSKILIVDGTSYIGKFVAEAAAKSGHQTFVQIRESTASDPAKAKIIESFESSGVTLLHGDLYDHESLVKAIKQVDVVIFTGGNFQLADVAKITAAIKEAGNTERFVYLFSVNEVDTVNAFELEISAFNLDPEIRRVVEEEVVPYTYVNTGFLAGACLPKLCQSVVSATPRGTIIIPGDGNFKVVINEESDMAVYIIKAVDDPRTLNQVIHISPLANTLSFNELVSLLEKKTGKTLEKIYDPEVDVLISTVGSFQLADPGKIIAAIKEAGNTKRLVYSSSGNQADLGNPFEPEKSAYKLEPKIHGVAEEEGVPHTYVNTGCFPRLCQPAIIATPRDKIIIPGDGNFKVVLNEESDIAAYIIKAVDDPRTLNQVLHTSPLENTLSFNELISLLEKQTGKTLEKIYDPGRGQTNFEIDPSFGVEASKLYPDVKYMTGLFF